MENKTSGVVVGMVFALVVGAGAGYWYGAGEGYDKGYAQAEADIEALESESARIATEEAAKAANPFAVENPLQNVETDPLEKLKKTLNPFE